MHKGESMQRGIMLIATTPLTNKPIDLIGLRFPDYLLFPQGPLGQQTISKGLLRNMVITPLDFAYNIDYGKLKQVEHFGTMTSYNGRGSIIPICAPMNDFIVKPDIEDCIQRV